MSQLNKISFFLLTYGEFKFTKNCLDYALSNLGEAKLDEILIYDTVPPPWLADETQGALKIYADQVNDAVQHEFMKIVTLEENLGSNLTFNQAIQACKKENDVVTMGNDVMMGPNWLQPLVDCAYNEKWKDIVGWVGPYVSPEICLDQIINPVFRQNYFNTPYSEFLHSDHSPEDTNESLNKLYNGDFNKFARQFVNRYQPDDVYDMIHGSCCYIKREVINKVGILDENFAYLLDGRAGGRGSDDIDMWIRLTNAGLFNLTTFKSFGHHVACGTTKQRTEPHPVSNIHGGNRLINKWEKTDESITFPYPIIGKKVPHYKFKPRSVKIAGDMNQVDWGTGQPLGLDYMINTGREDAFPF